MDRNTLDFRCAWAAPPLNEEAELPKKLPLGGNTIRYQLQVSCGGKGIRLTFSNEYSKTTDPPEVPLEIESVHIAKLKKPGEPDIYTESDAEVTFGGKKSALVPAGGTITSDCAGFEFEALDFLAVSVKFGKIPEHPACHREADCGSWLFEGDKVSENLAPSEFLWSYFSLCRADALTSAEIETLVCFGDSITDGAVSTFNGFDAWPNILAQGLAKDKSTERISAVNCAIAGNAIWGGYGVAAKIRFKRDVLDIPGVKYAIILIGTNDIPGAQRDTSEEMMAEYKAMLEACHSRGIKVYAGSITPFWNNDWWRSELHEQIRKKVNDRLMSDGSGFDGRIDFASATADPSCPAALKAEYDSGDGLHPSAAGHRAMGEAALRAMKRYLGK